FGINGDASGGVINVVESAVKPSKNCATATPADGSADSRLRALRPSGIRLANRPLLLWTDPPPGLPRPKRREAADGTAEVPRDVRVEQPVPEETDEITRQQHDAERDQQSLP